MYYVPAAIIFSWWLIRHRSRPFILSYSLIYFLRPSAYIENDSGEVRAYQSDTWKHIMLLWNTNWWYQKPFPLFLVFRSWWMLVASDSLATYSKMAFQDSPMIQDSLFRLFGDVTYIFLLLRVFLFPTCPSTDYYLFTFLSVIYCNYHDLLFYLDSIISIPSLLDLSSVSTLPPLSILSTYQLTPVFPLSFSLPSLLLSSLLILLASVFYITIPHLGTVTYVLTLHPAQLSYELISYVLISHLVPFCSFSLFCVSLFLYPNPPLLSLITQFPPLTSQCSLNILSLLAS